MRVTIKKNQVIESNQVNLMMRRILVSMHCLPEEEVIDWLID